MARAGKTDPTEVADRLHSAAIHLLRHARQRDVLTQEGPARLSALSVLVFVGPMTLGQLAAAEQVKPPTMSRIVAGLKAVGLVKSEGDTQDARRIHVSATSKGRTLLQQARERRIQLLAETFAGVSESEILILQKAAEIIERAVRVAR